MAELFDIPQNQDKISILDAGAGSGILSCAMIERLEKIETISNIEVVCYEIDKKCIAFIAEKSGDCK